MPWYLLLDREICLGRNFTLRALFLDIIYTLAESEILVPADEKLEIKYNEGFIRCVAISIPTSSSSSRALSSVTQADGRLNTLFKRLTKPRSAASLKLVGDVGVVADSSREAIPLVVVDACA